MGWNLSQRCRTEDALAAVERAVSNSCPPAAREANPDADHGQWHAVHFLALLGNAGTAQHHASLHCFIITQRATATSNGSVAAGKRRRKWGEQSIVAWKKYAIPLPTSIEKYNYDRPHRGMQVRAPHEAFLDFTAVLNSETLTV